MSGMAKGERDELAKILKARARLANRVVEQQAAKLQADVEQQLSSRYKIGEMAWADLTLAASKAVEQADAELAKRCRALGIPEEFRPSLTISWYGRGENADGKRRTELRTLAARRIEAMAAEARVAIEMAALDGLTHLTTGALASDEARAFLEAMPTVERLMPRLDVAALGPLALSGGTR